MQATHKARFKAAQIIPVIVIDRLQDAVPMAEALVAGGLDVLEVTLRTEHGLKAVEQIAAKVPEALVGVGTAINQQHILDSKSAGATFAVSPGLSASVIDAAQSVDLDLLPGVANAGDMMVALDAGIDFVKFFPAETLGGISALKAYGGPFAQLEFCPTGGIKASTAKDYLALSNVVCVGGSWVLPADDIAAGNWQAITALCKAAKTEL
ncbi:MAG: bifunctional 4-hydroxy-2-oxoglutarate aldolase/2-dehydro-3-deoxy-phosphogluconate aldolase [Gammaproteobacteria bacterium]|nr:bifunctional 4-hydroxy-2-oxoglutarate aldolase/2-dehydro-3-deoxy-phosphogluconate aldolase [Gammaproteobacteria bacterium]